MVRSRLAYLDLRTRHREVLCFDLYPDLDLDPLYSLLATENLDSSTYSIWAGLVTSSDHGGLSLPDYVLAVVRRTQAGVDFSFVSTGEEDEEESELLSIQ